MRFWPPALCAAFLGVAIACHRDGSSDILDPALAAASAEASCGTSTALFTSLPMDPQVIMGWVPLGSLNPPGHTFPTDHQYIYLTAAATQSAQTLYAPGDMYITGAGRTQYGSQPNNADYSLTFSACRETWGNFGHVVSVAPQILSKLGAFNVGCNTYSPTPNNPVTACYTNWTSIPVHAGDVIGTAIGLDLSWFDNRVPKITYANPSRWLANASGFDHFHVVPFSDYYTEPLRTTIRSMLGRFDGKVKRTIEPLGGTLATDVAGSAQGVWFFGSEPTYPESPHLTIQPDNIVPTMIQISMGTSGNGMFNSTTRWMVPSASGPYNRDPSQITPGATVYCWDLNSIFDVNFVQGVALLQLVDATTLKIEGRLGANFACANQEPIAFSASVVTFKR